MPSALEPTLVPAAQHGVGAAPHPPTVVQVVNLASALVKGSLKVACHLMGRVGGVVGILAWGAFGENVVRRGDGVERVLLIVD
jgi:hypothetical protein